jgi:hypothetical protein
MRQVSLVGHVRACLLYKEHAADRIAAGCPSDEASKGSVVRHSKNVTRRSGFYFSSVFLVAR